MLKGYNRRPRQHGQSKLRRGRRWEHFKQNFARSHYERPDSRAFTMAWARSATCSLLKIFET